MNTVLVVDDNHEILEIISYHLTKKNYQVLTASDAGDALKLIADNPISLAILDIMMPDVNGFDLCKKIRETYFFPVLFLTARNSEQDKIKGFASGGDDYLIKPFSSSELIARVKSLIRRNTQYNQPQNRSLIRVANLELDTVSGLICVNSQRLDLTDIEYRILKLLLVKKPEPLNTETIYNSIWGDAFTISPNNNVVVHIKNIRRKISLLDDKTDYIHTVWGKGYSIHA